MKRKNYFWEVINYFCLIGLIVGQITVGYAYIFAQIIYLICILNHHCYFHDQLLV